MPQKYLELVIIYYPAL